MLIQWWIKLGPGGWQVIKDGLKTYEPDLDQKPPSTFVKEKKKILFILAKKDHNVTWIFWWLSSNYLICLNVSPPCLP